MFLREKQFLLVFNKVDQIDEIKKEQLLNYFSQFDCEKVFISAKHSQNTEQLEDQLFKMAQLPEVGENAVMVTNMRHYEVLKNAHESILRVIDGLEQGISGDFLSQDIRECLHYLGEITGEITTDEVLGNIFKKFCIGKYLL